MKKEYKFDDLKIIVDRTSYGSNNSIPSLIIREDNKELIIFRQKEDVEILIHAVERLKLLIKEDEYVDNLNALREELRI